MARVRYSTSFVPIFGIRSGCALTNTPWLATSRRSGSSVARLPSFADRIDPDEDAVYAQQLLAHTVGDLIGVDRSLDVEADVAQRLRDVAQPRLLELQRRAATRIAGKHHRHPVCALPHRMSLGRTRPLSWPLPHGESVCIDARMMFGPRDQFVHVRFGRVEGAGDTDDARARSAAAREAVTLGDQPFPDRPGQGDQDEVDLGRPAKVHAGNRRQPVAHRWAITLA